MIPLKLVDHGKLLTAGLTLHIQERTEKLGHFFEGIKGCRVTVDGPGNHPLRGRVRVRISLALPDEQIAINRQSGADLPMAIRESFDAADQKVEDYVRRSRDRARAKSKARA